MDWECHDSRYLSVNFPLKQPPTGLMSTNVASIQILFYLILINTKLHSHPVMALVLWMYLIHLTLQVSSELMWHMKTIKSRGEYGTTH